MCFFDKILPGKAVRKLQTGPLPEVLSCPLLTSQSMHPPHVSPISHCLHPGMQFSEPKSVNSSSLGYFDAYGLRSIQTLTSVEEDVRSVYKVADWDFDALKVHCWFRV